MRKEFAEYREYLREGIRIEIGIPLSGGGVFRDWAIVHAAFEDELVAQISRDALPANVKIESGTIVDVSVWIGKDVYSCSGIVVDRIQAMTLKIRLFGYFTLRERRQFFRIDLDLRVKYALVDGVPKESLKKEWEQRVELEQMRFQGYDQVVIAAHKARFTPAFPVEWRDLVLTPVNLSGGGLRLRFPEPVHPELLVNLEIHLPMVPVRVVYAVGEVIHVMEPREPKGEGWYQAAGMQFVFLDERDRDLVFQHISTMQIENLRRHAEKRVREEKERVVTREPMSLPQVAVRVVWVVLFLVLVFLGVRYLLRYQQRGSNEIQKTYEKAIRQYRKQPAPP